MSNRLTINIQENLDYSWITSFFFQYKQKQFVINKNKQKQFVINKNKQKQIKTKDALG
jgi:hypothetical protein